MSRNTVDVLGDRIKGYERRETDRKAMPGLPIIARLDGRGFSKFTKGMDRPFDANFSNLMIEVAKYLVDQTDCCTAYVQSDEVTLVIDPFGVRSRKIVAEDSNQAHGEISETQFMFDGKFQKLTSVLAGMATSRFVIGAIALWPERVLKTPPAFDCRVFEVPSREEAANACRWRELDATKNAVSMATRAYFSHSRMQDKSSKEMQEMLFQEKGINFNDYNSMFKRGTYIQRKIFEKELSSEILARIPDGKRPVGPVLRSETVVLDMPPANKIVNYTQVILEGADPIIMKPTNDLEISANIVKP